MSKDRAAIWVRLTSTGAGRIGLAASARGLVLTTLPGWSGAGESGRARRPGPLGPSDDLFETPRQLGPPAGVAALLDASERALAAYYATWPDSPGRRIGSLWDAVLDLAVDLEGLTAFSRSVLERLRRVPPGEVITYGQLAAAVGSARAARAVGSVMAHNPLPIVLPCHRVIASDGGLGGFAGSTKEEAQAFKERLLRYEGWVPAPSPEELP